MQAQPHHAGFDTILKTLLALGVIAALGSLYGPLLREAPSSSSYEWGSGPSPTASPEAIPSGESSGEGPLFEAAPRPAGVPQAEGPVEAGTGTSSPWGLTGDDAYDCNVMGVQLATVSLASIKTFGDRAYENFLQAQQRGDFAAARQQQQSYATAQTDLEKKKWRCFHCAGESGCGEP